MPLLTVESDAPNIENLEAVLTESEKDKDGRIRLYSDKAAKKELRGTAKPNPITSGLNEFQVEKLKECVYNIRNVDGAYKFFVAKQLYELRGIIRGKAKGENPKQWMAFKKSGLIPFSPREMQDLVNSYQWMRDSGIEPANLNTIGVRTISIIATTDNKPAQARLTTRLIGGEQITAKQAIEECVGLKKPQTNVGLEAFLAQEKTKYDNKPMKALKEKIHSLLKENYELKAKQKALRDSLKINP